MPPLVGVAVKVTEVPAHIMPDGTAAILTLTGRIGFTVIVTRLEVAGLPDSQGSLEVSLTVIASALANVVEV